MSAKGGVEEQKKEQAPKKNVEYSNKNKKVPEGCFPFTLSCGVQGTACGDNTAELAFLIWEVDKVICGK